MPLSGNMLIEPAKLYMLHELHAERDGDVSFGRIPMVSS